MWNRAFSLDVTAAILEFQNKETSAILVYQTSPLGVELYFYAKMVFCLSKPIWRLVRWVKTLNSMRMAACIINVWGCAKHRLRGERRSWSSWPQLLIFFLQRLEHGMVLALGFALAATASAVCFWLYGNWYINMAWIFFRSHKWGASKENVCPAYILWERNRERKKQQNKWKRDQGRVCIKMALFHLPPLFER